MSTSRVLLRTSTSKSILTIAASATALALTATVAASSSWSAAPAGAGQHVSHQTQTLTLTSIPLSSESPAVRAREIAWGMMRTFRWRPRFQFRYLRWLWDRESSWNVYATNPYSGAYGIPQAVPGYKMSSAGRNWRTSPWVQIRWGLRYIRARYGSPKEAWYHEVAYGWY